MAIHELDIQIQRFGALLLSAMDYNPQWLQRVKAAWAWKELKRVSGLTDWYNLY